MMNVFEKMQLASTGFTKTDMQIYDFIVGHPSETVHMNIQEIADEVHVSKSAMLRFTQRVGYSGFSEFKYEFSRYVHSGVSHSYDISYQSKFEEIVNIYEKTIAFMNKTIKEEDIKELIEMMLKANKIKLFGINSTGLSVKQMRNRFHKIAFDAEAVTDPVLIPEIALQGKLDDLHMFFSTSGNTPVMVDAIKNASSKGIHTILITMNEKSKMSEFAEMQFLLPSTKMIMSDYFLDLQAINYIFIEIIISYLGEKLENQ